MRRLVVPPALVAVLLATGCGEERRIGPSQTADRAPTSSATTSATPTATPSQAAAAGPLAGFPLDLGYERENGDDHSPVEVTGRPGLDRFGYCGNLVWDPHAGTTDLIGVEYRGEAEWTRGRTLVLYPSVDAATEALAAAHDVIADCPEEPPDEGGNSTAHTLVDVSLGDQSTTWIDQFRSADLGGHFDTGLVVYDLVRVGRAVLASYEYGEGNGSDQSRDRSIAEATSADRPIVALMDDLPCESAALQDLPH